jgi:hypothetical protein
MSTTVQPPLIASSEQRGSENGESIPLHERDPFCILYEDTSGWAAPHHCGANRSSSFRRFKAACCRSMA